MYYVWDDITDMSYIYTISTPISSLNFDDNDILCQDLDEDGLYN
jgi:hypothetical protein